jgi:hypothetical protein
MPIIAAAGMADDADAEFGHRRSSQFEVSRHRLKHATD